MTLYRVPQLMKSMSPKRKIFPPLAIVNTYDNSFLAELRAIREFIPNRNTIGKFHEVPKDTSVTIRFKCSLLFFFFVKELSNR